MKQTGMIATNPGGSWRSNNERGESLLQRMLQVCPEWMDAETQFLLSVRRTNPEDISACERLTKVKSMVVNKFKRAPREAYSPNYL